MHHSASSLIFFFFLKNNIIFFQESSLHTSTPFCLRACNCYGNSCQATGFFCTGEWKKKQVWVKEIVEYKLFHWLHSLTVWFFNVEFCELCKPTQWNKGFWDDCHHAGHFVSVGSQDWEAALLRTEALKLFHICQGGLNLFLNFMKHVTWVHLGQKVAHFTRRRWDLFAHFNNIHLVSIAV